MRPAKVTDAQLYEDLAAVFRRKGYAGTSYSDIREATGLVKASLYHRFPGGKEAMVTAGYTDIGREQRDDVPCAELDGILGASIRADRPRCRSAPRGSKEASRGRRCRHRRRFGCVSCAA